LGEVVPGTAPVTDKVRENRLRRLAISQGLQVTKARIMAPPTNYGGPYRILSPNIGQTEEAGMSLDRVENYLTWHGSDLGKWAREDDRIRLQENE